MKKTYDKNPLMFALIWIGVYCVLQSLGNMISSKIGINKSANAVLAAAQTVFLLLWLHKYGLMKAFGLNKPTQSGKRMLFYIPLVLICTRNLWNGCSMNLEAAELCFHIILMICVGFLEELIFRGFLFEAMAKDNMKSAVLVSSITFGLGHIINLFNGSGMGAAEVLLQIVMAVAMGFLLVMVYLRSGSLIPCMAAHALINISSAFSNNSSLTMKTTLLQHGLMLAIIIAYLLILSKTAPLKRK
ncbi:MAG: CPBP family intramembrane glutamic endopeptidase [Candidatus Limivicinus sp.]|jgi:membrane protease YdiL (CAAX protease family)